MAQDLPDGWKRVEDEKGAIFYLTPPPQVKITKRSQLVNYHQRSRYLEMDPESLDFGKRRRVHAYSCVKVDDPDMQVNTR